MTAGVAENQDVGNGDGVCQWFECTGWGFREWLNERPTREPSSGGERRKPATGGKWEEECSRRRAQQLGSPRGQRPEWLEWRA